MPAFRRRHHDRTVFLSTQRSHRLGLGLGERGGLNGLAFAVEAVELCRKTHAFGRILSHEEIDTEAGAADPPARIYARAEQETEMPRLWRPAEARDVHQGGEPRSLPRSQT